MYIYIFFMNKTYITIGSSSDKVTVVPTLSERALGRIVVMFKFPDRVEFLNHLAKL